MELRLECLNFIAEIQGVFAILHYSRLQDVTVIRITIARASGVPRNFFRLVQQIQLRKENREKGDRGA